MAIEPWQQQWSSNSSRSCEQHQHRLCLNMYPDAVSERSDLEMMKTDTLSHIPFIKEGSEFLIKINLTNRPCKSSIAPGK